MTLTEAVDQVRDLGGGFCRVGSDVVWRIERQGHGPISGKTHHQTMAVAFHPTGDDVTADYEWVPPERCP